MALQLKYNDERDRSYGLTGVAISMVALDAEEYLDSISLDAPVGNSIEFSHDFFFITGPSFSAKSAWNERLKHFQITAGMIIANMMCRNYVQHRRKLSSDILDSLRDFVRDEGSALCSLEDDETDEVFNRSVSYFDRLFSYARVHEIANDFADNLINQRHVSAQEAVERLRQLSMI